MSDQKNAVEDLLKAEEKANRLIKEAQLEREKKLKSARVAAEQEIAVYRKEREAKYQEEIAKFGNSNEEQDLESKTQKEISQINRDFEANQKKVTQLLMDRIMNVEIEIPEVLKGNFEEYFKKK